MDYIFDKNDILYAILKLGHEMKRKAQNKLKQYDITLEQWLLLYFVYQNEGCNQKKLSETSSRDTGAMTRSLNTLENKGLIERKSSYQDKREFLIYLTSEGKNLYKDTSEVMSQNAREIKSIFGESELEQFMYLLEKLDSNLE
ncbi:MarR family transcriptional regulator [uncultured Methanobacterium sp.]|uniref:MarR family winged helix-turn-helix transcriptional regulator n=1 Tax=uncultured Methanobacterium sp. TaxID=176306 RepID=UPI002AA86F63|nr:MarR family transcriptional regulator [uncultured Methanobacterium sp.]